MSLAQVFTRAGVGITAPEVIVEVHVGGGLPRVSLVGLPAVVSWLDSKKQLPSVTAASHTSTARNQDLRDVYGQQRARRALDNDKQPAPMSWILSVHEPESIARLRIQ